MDGTNGNNWSRYILRVRGGGREVRGYADEGKAREAMLLIELGNSIAGRENGHEVWDNGAGELIASSGARTLTPDEARLELLVALHINPRKADFAGRYQLRANVTAGSAAGTTERHDCHITRESAARQLLGIARAAGDGNRRNSYDDEISRLAWQYIGGGEDEDEAYRRAEEAVDAGIERDGSWDMGDELVYVYERSRAERLDSIEEELAFGGITPEEAASLRRFVEIDGEATA